MKIARVGQVGEDPRACPARTNGQHCQLFLWQAERTIRRHSRDDPRENVRVRVRVGPVEFQLKAVRKHASPLYGNSRAIRDHTMLLAATRQR